MATAYRYYTSNEIIEELEEDATHEFKGHMNLTVEEVPPWAQGGGSEKSSRKPISRVLNAFLNTGRGGIVYLGITDDGTVKGVSLTQFKKDHLHINLETLMSQYTPPIPKHRYKIRFIPVVPQDSSKELIEKLITIAYSQQLDVDKRLKPHALKTHKPCWCDQDCIAVLNTDRNIPVYVVEIHISAWDPDDPLNADSAIGKLRASPIYECETNEVYVRKQACVAKWLRDEVLRSSKERVKDYYIPKLDRLKEEMIELQQQIHSLEINKTAS